MWTLELMESGEQIEVGTYDGCRVVLSWPCGEEVLLTVERALAFNTRVRQAGRAAQLPALVNMAELGYDEHWLSFDPETGWLAVWESTYDQVAQFNYEELRTVLMAARVELAKAAKV